MDGAIESGERVANEIMFDMFGKSEKGKMLQIDYEKTFYYHRELINAIDEKNNGGSSSGNEKSVRPYERLKKWSRLLLPFVAGAGSLILIQFKYALPNYGLMQLTKKIFI